MTRAISLGVLSCALVGCGTVQNFTKQTDGTRPLKVFGGVSESAETLKSNACGGDLVAAAWAPLCAVDVVFSAVGDTLTLPLTVPAAVSRSITGYYFPDGRAPEKSGEQTTAPTGGKT